MMEAEAFQGFPLFAGGENMGLRRGLVGSVLAVWIAAGMFVAGCSHKPPARPAKVDPAANLAAGQELMAEHHPEQAIAEFDKAIEINLDYADAYNARGLARRQTGDLNGAFQDFNKVIELDPKRAEAYASRGLLLLANGQTDPALKDFNRAVELNPHLPAAYDDLGRAHLVLGLSAEAKADFDKAIATDPNFVSAYVHRGIFGAERTAICKPRSPMPIKPLTWIRRVPRPTANAD